MCRELKDANQEPEILVSIPDEDDIFWWHFTFEGPPDSPFSGGIYHGELNMPPNYPMGPPTVKVLTVIFQSYFFQKKYFPIFCLLRFKPIKSQK